RGLFMADRVTALSLETSPLGRAMRGESVDGAEVYAQMGEEGRWYAVSARPWLREVRDGHEVDSFGAVGVFRDVTRERATQNHLMTSDRMASVGLLAAGVAHEINNPLASVLTNLEVARKETLPRALSGDASAGRELAEILSDAREAAERVHHIVRDLKIFSRHEEVQDGVSDVHAVLESTLRMANNEIRHRATLVKELHPVDPVEGSESRLGQVFLNLIVNAAQAIPEGNASAHMLTVKTGQEGERVHVAVSDTGVGMGPDALRRLFLPFYTTKGPGAGTGLGLAISHSIVRSLGGEIKVESEPGRGTTFTVFLKAAHVARTVRPVSTTSANKASSERGRVLVIDDEPLIGLSIKRLLARSHEVTPLTSASEALELLRSERFDIILCDLMMPQMTGMDFHAALEKEDPRLASQVVFLTGGAFTPAARAFLDRVPNTRLNKPFASSELKGLIDQRVNEQLAADS
ncbi:MAG TPA: ATP-binding protein, partial [Myxococcota bacterium]|nr:ATP-binding protein [Myxococcota bacterium]